MTGQVSHVEHRDKTSPQRGPVKPVGRGPLAPAPQSDARSLQQAIADPSQARPADILALQRSAGNRAVTRLIQAKLTVGAAGDRYEQEADRIADQVMSGQQSAFSGQLSAVGGQPSAVSRQAEEEEEVQTKPLAASITPLVQRQAEDEEEVQTFPSPGGRGARGEVQTFPSPGGRGGRGEGEIQRRADGGFEAGPDIESRLAAHKGGGSPLPDDVRAAMGPRFGADFGGVRVHTGGEADQLNRQLSAQAFTHGQDIYMAAGKYAPGTAAGNRLLAHELTHTIQQTGMRPVRNIARAAKTVQRNGDPPKSLTEHPMLEQARQGPEEEVDEVQLGPAVPRVARDILQPVLQGRARFDIESDPSSIIRPIYASYWNYASAHLQYVASAREAPGPVLAGTETRGMCQTFTRVFEELFNILNRTLGAHFFDVSTDESLANARFYTGPGLTLVGNTGCRGNIYMQTNDGGQIVAMGYANINRFYYTYHWRPRINGIVFDPLFQNDPAAIPVTMVTAVPNTLYTYTDGTNLLCLIKGAQQLPSFGSNYIMVNNKTAFETKRQAVIDLYNLTNAGWRERKRATGKWFPSSEINRRCRTLLATLGDLTVFETVANCYNDGNVAGTQRFLPMLNEVRKRAQ
jgi:hypothetical protein